LYKDKALDKGFLNIVQKNGVLFKALHILSINPFVNKYIPLGSTIREKHLKLESKESRKFSRLIEEQ
jgi:hypothetical protein